MSNDPNTVVYSAIDSPLSAVSAGAARGPCCHGAIVPVGVERSPPVPSALGDHDDSQARHERRTLADRTVQLGRALQAAGVNVSLSEIIDAARSITEIDLAAAVGAARRARDRRSSSKPATTRRSSWPSTATSPPAWSATARDDQRLATAADDELISELAAGGDLGAMAAALVDEYAGLDGDIRSEKHHLQRVFLGADIARLMSRVRIADPDLSPALIRARVDELKRLIGADVRAQIDARSDVIDLVDIEAELHDVDFLEASRAELDQMRDAIRPIARKLAARLAKRRQHRIGRVNMRRTMRRSLGSGGVPIDVLHDRPRAHKPELFVLCDISGSVADFSLFTLTLMSALSAELARTRSFVFVDAVDEVTDLLASTSHGIEPWQLLRNTNVIGDDGHSDYGAVLERFWRDDRRPRPAPHVDGDRHRRRPHQPPGHRRGVARPHRRTGPPRLLAQPRAARRLEHVRLGDGVYAAHCDADVRGAQPPPARRRRRAAVLTRASRLTEHLGLRESTTIWL